MTIAATVNPAAVGTSVSNQGSVSFDADGNGTNETLSLSDDPGTGAAADPTVFAIADVVAAPAPTPIPTLSEWALLLMSGLLALMGFGAMRRRGA